MRVSQIPPTVYCPILNDDDDYAHHKCAVLSLTLVTVQTDYPDCCPYIVQYIAIYSTPTLADSRLTLFFYGRASQSTSTACTRATSGTSTTRRTTTTTTRLRKPCRGTSSTCFTPTSSTNQKRPRFPSCRMARNTAKRVFCESARGRRTKVRVLRLSQIPDDCLPPYTSCEGSITSADCPHYLLFTTYITSALFAHTWHLYTQD